MKLAYMNNLTFKGLLALALLGMLLSSGCALKDPGTGTDFAKDFEVVLASEEISWPGSDLKKRFEQYWGLRFQGQIEEIRAIEAPYLQEMIPFGQYRNYMRGAGRNTLKKIEVFDIVQRSENFVEISLNLHFEKESGEETTSGRRDRWVRAQDEWFHVIRDPLIFPATS